MTRLLHLPSESLLQIIDYLDPRSIQSLSLCNKFICEVAEEKRYASIGIYDIGLRAEIAFHPLVLLHKILSSPRFAVCPRTLIFDRWSDQSGYDEVAIKEDLGYDICTMLWSYGYLKTEEIAGWYEKTKADPNESPHHQPWAPVMAIVVKLLPNVQCIEVHEEGIFASVVRELVGSASEAEGRQHTHSTLDLKVIRKLRKVAMHVQPNSWRYPPTTDFRPILQLSTLPSIKVIYAENISWWPQYPYRSNPHTGASVQEVNFQCCRVRTGFLVDLIKDVRHLKSFTYNNCTPGGRVWRPEKIVESLRSHVQSSLECLDLTTCSRLNLPVTGGFHEFTALKRLRVTAHLLDHQCLPRHLWERMVAANPTEYNSTDPHLPRMTNILPPSLETFILVGWVGSEQMGMLMDGLIIKKESVLPSLKEITIKQYRSLPSLYHPRGRTARRLKSLGVAFKVVIQPMNHDAEFCFTQQRNLGEP